MRLIKDKKKKKV